MSVSSYTVITYLKTLQCRFESRIQIEKSKPKPKVRICFFGRGDRIRCAYYAHLALRAALLKRFFSPLVVATEKHYNAGSNPTITRIKGTNLMADSFYLVEVTGFEPAASSSRTKRSTKLSHTSILNFKNKCMLTNQKGVRFYFALFLLQLKSTILNFYFID